MPRKSVQKKKSNSKNLTNLWTAISPESWLQFFLQYKPGNNFSIKGNKDIWGQCIYRQHMTDNTPSFHVNLGRGFAKCFGCGKYTDDPSEVAAAIMGISKSEALSHILSTYTPEGFGNLQVEADSDAADQKLKEYIWYLLNSELLDAVVNQNSAEYAYAKPCLDWLKSRNIPENLFHTLPIGIIPPTKNLYDRLKNTNETDRKELKEKVQEYLETVVPRQAGKPSEYEGHLVFVTHLSPNRIGYFRTRPPFSDSSAVRAIKDPNTEKTGLGFFGLGLTQLFSNAIGGEEANSKHVIAIEGEFDALAAIIPQTQTDAKVVVVGTCGKGTNSLNPLYDCGFNEIWLVPDRDTGGTSFVKLKLNATTNPDIITKVFKYPTSFGTCKDAHAAYMHVGGEKVLEEVSNPSNYESAASWAANQLVDEVSNSNSIDVRGTYKLSSSYASMLHSKVDVDAFCTKVGKALNIDPDTIKKYCVSSDTEESYMNRMAELLSKKFFFVGVDQSRNIIYAWERSTKKEVSFNTNKRSECIATMCMQIQSITTFFESELGIPPTLRDVEPPAAFMNRTIVLEDYLIKSVLPNLSHGLPSINSLETLASGVHIFDKEIFIVNGHAFIHGEIEDNRIIWEDLTSPVYGNYYLKGDASEAWSEFITCADDLNNPHKMDLRHTIDRMKYMISVPYRFVHQELEQNYLAHFAFVPVFASGLKEIPFISISAQYMSGKSTFAQEVISSVGINARKVNLIEHAIYVTGSTEAGIRQAMSGATLMVCIDEFESVSDEANANTSARNNKNCQEILELVRSANAMSGAHVWRGTSSGEKRNFSLRLPLAVVGINPLNRGPDFSRFNSIEMAEAASTGPGGPLPDIQIIRAGFTEEEIKELRYTTTMWPLVNWIKLKNAYRDMAVEIGEGGYMHKNTTARARNTLIPILTLMKLADEDYKNFANAYTALKSERYIEKYDTNTGDTLLSAVVMSPKVTLPGDEHRGRIYTVNQILGDPMKRAIINESNCGVYYVENKQGKDKIIFVWPTIRAMIFPGTTYSTWTNSLLTNTAAKKKAFDTPKMIKDQGLTTAISNLLGGMLIRVSDISSMDADNFFNGSASLEDTMKKALDGPGMRVISSVLEDENVAAIKDEVHNI